MPPKTPKKEDPRFTYTYPDTAQKMFGMRDRSQQSLDPESPTAQREFEIQQRGGAYSDRIIRRPQGPSRSRAMRMRRTERT